jgi:hypothetical protein
MQFWVELLTIPQNGEGSGQSLGERLPEVPIARQELPMNRRRFDESSLEAVDRSRDDGVDNERWCAIWWAKQPILGVLRRAPTSRGREQARELNRATRDDSMPSQHPRTRSRPLE